EPRLSPPDLPRDLPTPVGDFPREPSRRRNSIGAGRCISRRGIGSSRQLPCCSLAPGLPCESPGLRGTRPARCHRQRKQVVPPVGRPAGPLVWPLENFPRAVPTAPRWPALASAHPDVKPPARQPFPPAGA